MGMAQGGRGKMWVWHEGRRRIIIMGTCGMRRGNRMWVWHEGREEEEEGCTWYLRVENHSDRSNAPTIGPCVVVHCVCVCVCVCACVCVRVCVCVCV